MKTLILMVRKIECSQPGSSFTAMTVILAASGRKQGEHCTFFTASFMPRHAVTFTFTCALVSAPLHAYGEEQTGFTATAGWNLPPCGWKNRNPSERGFKKRGCDTCVGHSDLVLCREHFFTRWIKKHSSFRWNHRRAENNTVLFFSSMWTHWVRFYSSHLDIPNKKLLREISDVQLLLRIFIQ